MRTAITILAPVTLVGSVAGSVTLVACTPLTGAPTTQTLLPEAVAHAPDPFEPYDLDRDGLLSEREIGVRYGEWDRDADDVVGGEELAGGMFSAWDVNDNGVLDGDELMAARDDWFPDQVVVHLADLDRDGDGAISWVEMREGVPNLEGFEYYDRDGDGLVSSEELTRTTVRLWDEDDDGALSRAEWPGGRDRFG